MKKIWRVLYNWWKGFRRLFRRFRKIQPIFSSSFIQYWYCQNWDCDRWIEEYRMLQKIGIHEIILQSTVDTKSYYAVYPTKMEGYSSNSTDMIETALSAADSIGMNVRIGLGFNNDWWSIDTHEQEWLDHEAEVNTVIVREIATMYGGHRAFAGWYIPYEIHPLMALNNVQQANLNLLLKKIAGSIHSISMKTIMIAPFYNGRLSGPVTLTLWSNSVRHIFNDTGIDILALQDSIGAGFNTLGDLDEIYSYTQKAANEIGLNLYAVTETFEETSGGNIPAPHRRILKQLSKTSDYVSGFVAFSINHYQNGNEPTQVNGYEHYYRYFLNHLK
ncbi:DUF4434 domain-containing protein [Desulfosporosinus sp. Sb-LF]|uniref:DUF4434 domain-containing protein n=1 Tax=Desulfosporosinus sp. Sb-LF TaxID=2560027 RepID=UPI00107EFDE2|nr:DUF4434 domain-containing protein [Desulfosporosinus sp. Sb-LF]TGE31812.1 DUF4434 domain-containing protein [Desulfosporosinus sp. Sb-LF]